MADHGRLIRCVVFLTVLVLTASSASAGAVYRGVFEPRAQAVIPSELSMTVKRMALEPGERCRAGDVLVEFDDTLPQAAVDSAATKLDAAQQNYTSTQNLFDRNQITATELARARTELAEAELKLATARRDVEACVVRAPFAGKIVEEQLRATEWANRGAPLLLLMDDSVLLARFYLPEDRFSAISVGDTVTVRTPAVPGDFSGTVTRLGVVFDPVSRTFDAWAEVANPDDTLRAGMTAEVEWPANGSGP
ncbi:MAG: efflux RND transporter periplasmic adaptor subunit [Planctomycetes bacterium]|nr:efflux RND transporter periplasmic adaptor subunit [Planctomycetota bacterium]